MKWSGPGVPKTNTPHSVVFDNIDGWAVERENAIATLELSDEELLFADRSAKLTYRREAAGEPTVRLIPPAPIDAPTRFDCVSFWVYGNNWAFLPDTSTPPVTIWVVFGSPGGPDVTVDMTHVRWVEWWVMCGC